MARRSILLLLWWLMGYGRVKKRDTERERGGHTQVTDGWNFKYKGAMGK